MKKKKKVSHIPPMSDEDLEKFWDEHEPEEFDGWQEGDLQFVRPAKKLIQLRLDPRDVREIDREAKRTGIDRAQLVRSWVREKLAELNRAE
ncbi:MAG: ribbon-helix-helix protein, CopG family [Deltaproteobacteria bacterium]|nr:ribbon-helix-helix protein, CopG family [Deltaproteobacteria bacterium]MBW2070793.1 ribbon-helix-helix protein, CopG family [Deltaproteobacteria bacterium]